MEVLWTTTNDMVNRVHKRTLRVLLGDYDSIFEELLYRNEEVIIYEKNLQKPMLDVHRCVTFGIPSFLWEFINRKILPNTSRIKISFNFITREPKNMETNIFHLG